MNEREARPDIDIAAGEDPLLFVKRMVSIAEAELGITVELIKMRSAKRDCISRIFFCRDLQKMHDRAGN